VDPDRCELEVFGLNGRKRWGAPRGWLDDAVVAVAPVRQDAVPEDAGEA
jgi:hypothetical protein